MAYYHAIPAQGNIVRTASGDLVRMQGNFEHLNPVASGLIVSGSGSSARLAGYYYGQTTKLNRFRMLYEVAGALNIYRNTGSESSPSWQRAMSISESSAGPITFDYVVVGQTPTGPTHLTTKAYVDGLSTTLSGLTDTNLTAVADGSYMTFDQATQKWIDSALALTLNDLTDVAAGSPTSGYSLVYNGSQWIPSGISGGGGGSATLSGLTDTNLTSVADNSIMVFDQASQKWIDAAYPTDTDTLSGLTDTNLTAVADGASLVFDQATQKWIDGTPPAETLSGLTDTNLTSVPDAAIMVFDQATQKWIDAVHAHALNDLTDATISGPTSGQRLEYNGSAWVNVARTDPGYGMITLSADQTTNLTSGDRIDLDTDWGKPVASGITITTSGTLVLASGGHYQLLGVVGASFTGATGTCHARWYDITADQYIGSEAEAVPYSSTSNTSHLPQSHALVITSGGSVEVDLRISQTPTALNQFDQDHTGAVVIEFSGAAATAAGGGGGSATLSGLTDTNLTAVADQGIMVFDQATQKWIDSAYPTDTDTLSGLTDTNLTAVADGAIMTFDQATQKWIDSAPAAGTLSGLTDMNLTSVVDQGSLVFDQASQKWIDSTPVASGVGLIESFDIAVESVTSGDTFTVSLYAFYPYDVQTVRGKTTAGTCDLTFKIESTEITGLAGITVSGTETGWNSSAAKSVALGNTFSIEVDDASTCSGLLISIKTERT